MQPCRIEISTKTDGKETRVVKAGRMQLSSTSLALLYEENGGQVELTMQNGAVEISRKGDYSMFLHLEKGRITDGFIGVNGQSGKMQTRTNRLAYALNEKSALFSLHYDLLIGEEPQEMKLRIFAQYENDGAGNI